MNKKVFIKIIKRALSGLAFATSLLTIIALHNYDLCYELDNYSLTMIFLCFITMIQSFLLWEN